MIETDSGAEVKIARALAAGDRRLPTVADLCRQWVRLQEEYVANELRQREQRAKMPFDRVLIHFEGVTITEENHIARVPAPRRRVAQRAYRMARRRLEAERAELGLPELEARHEGYLWAMGRLVAQIQKTPVRTVADVAALLDAAMDSEITIEEYREDSPLLWHLVDGLKRLAPDIEMNATARNASLGRLFGLRPS
jgi:hypothetical protein